MKTLLHILVPESTTAWGIQDAVETLLEPHRRRHDEQSHWQYDYLCQFEPMLNCADTDAELPDKIRRIYGGRISRVQRLRPDVHAGAVVTPDGEWHHMRDFGWRMMNDDDSNQEASEKWETHYQQLLVEYPNCWVIETWAHS